MRRIAGYASFTLGWLLIFLAAFLYFYATPRIEKAPIDVYRNTVSIGTGSYFSASDLALVGPIPLQNLSVAKGDPSKSTAGVAVINVFSRTTDLQHGNDIDTSNEVYAFDRSTGYAVHCCGEHPRAEGLTLKFPFHTQRGTYRFWDSTAQRAYPATFVRTETVDGMTTDVFVSHAGPALLGTLNLPGKVVTGRPGPSVATARYYEATTTLWVEPFTGAILKAGQHQQQWAAEPTSRQRLVTLADTTFLNDANSVAQSVASIRGQIGQLKLVSLWLPFAGPILGLLFVFLGWRAIRSDDRARLAAEDAEPAAEPSAEAEPADAAPSTV